MLFEEYARAWLDAQKPKLKPLTVKIYRDLIERRLNPAFGATRLNRIDEKAVSEYAASLYETANLITGKGLSDHSAAQIVGLIKRIFRSAKKEGKTKRDPAAEISCRSGEHKAEAFSEHDQKAIERYVVFKKKPRLYGILISLYTGVRIGELLALKWSDVDLKARTLTIGATQSAVRLSGDGNPYLGAPKTNAGNRTIPFPAALLPFLKEMKAQNGAYVVSSRNGGIVLIRAYQKTFERVLQKLNVKRKGFHSLRHTFATRAVEEGADVKTLSEILGHSDPSVTLKCYVHSSEKQKTRVAEKVGERLKRYVY